MSQFRSIFSLITKDCQRQTAELQFADRALFLLFCFTALPMFSDILTITCQSGPW
jgi:hypothetical protein